MKLVVLESPNKVEKVKHYLGDGYEVLATAGHFRDLPLKELGVDLETFAPTYVVDDAKKAVVARIQARATRAEEVILGTDADREGEAISWHLAQVLRLANPRRLRYTEITEKGIKAALAAVSPLDQDLVDAQQARRVLDRLVGYQVSPLLAVFGKGHSAGRVQSATLHLVVARERERLAFKAEPYFTLTARYGNGLEARYATVNDEGELVDTRLATEDQAKAIAARARGPHVVRTVDTRPVERRPRPPFTTSSLQQAASAQLGLKPERTMALAQALFEKGHITYHRTDSVALSEDAVAMARAFIASDYPEALPSEAPRYKSKGGAQEAHEAIRPTSLAPWAASDVAADAQELYELIRKRFIASQCKPAILSQTTIGIESGDTTWRAWGSVVQFQGFLHYLADDEDSPAKKDEPPEPTLPKVAVGEVLDLTAIDVKRQETQPPGRFTQATLIREMERTGIGRPSTYAGTIALLFAREYLAEEKKHVYPTPRGFLVDEMLGKAFPELLATTTTAEMEARLDEVAGGKRRWKAEVRDWYVPFSRKLAAAPSIFAGEASKRPELAEATAAAPKPTGRPCPRCGAELLLKPRKKGPGAFLSCSAYPKCEYVADPSAKASERRCPKCQGPMEELAGKFGPYARCIAANCRATVDLAAPVDEKCPLCGSPMRDKGEFLSCSKYPSCRGSYDKAALAMAKKKNARCPKCGGYLLEKRGGKGPFLGCAAYPTCKHIEPRVAKRA